MTLDVESAYAIDFQQRYLVGAEAWIKDTLAFRAGYKWNYDLEQYAVGVGFKQAFKGDRTVTLDVAYSPLKKFGGIQLFDPVLRFSLGGAFRTKQTVRRDGDREDYGPGRHHFSYNVSGNDHASDFAIRFH